MKKVAALSESSTEARTRTATRIVAFIAALAFVCLCLCGIADCAGKADPADVQTPVTATDEGMNTDTAVEPTPTPVEPVNAIILDVAPVDQLPELPGGCEITSATIMLDYYGFACDKEELDSYLPQIYDYGADPSEYFIGTTSDGSGWYCEPGPIVVAVNDYLADKLTTLQAIDITGASPEELYTEVASGNPLCVWVTTYMQEREIMYTWTSDLGNECAASVQDHCMVLCGFDWNEDIVYLADPLDADDIVSYDRESFEASYTERGNMACMITVLR